MFCIVSTAHTDATAVISPFHDYTAFENNASKLTYNCSGNGTSLQWRVDGYTTGTKYVRNKGITFTHFIESRDGLSVSSQLTVPTTKANNNITVICIVQDSLLNYQQWSNPVKLFIQGTALAHICKGCFYPCCHGSPLPPPSSLTSMMTGFQQFYAYVPGLSLTTVNSCCRCRGEKEVDVSNEIAIISLSHLSFTFFKLVRSFYFPLSESNQ